MTWPFLCVQNYILTFPFTAASFWVGWLDGSTLSQGRLENVAIFFWPSHIVIADTRDPREREESERGSHATQGWSTRQVPGCVIRSPGFLMRVHATSGTLSYHLSRTWWYEKADGGRGKYTSRVCPRNIDSAGRDWPPSVNMMAQGRTFAQ